MERKMRLSLGWYSQNQEEWKEYLNLWKNESVEKHHYKGAILPHAGWYYSGHHAYRFFLGLEYKPDVIILMGGHRSSSDHSFYLNFNSFKTPFGSIIAEPYFSQIFEGAQWPTGVGDNSIEVFLPFIARFFPDKPLLAFSPAPGGEMRNTIDEIRNLIERNFKHPLILASADLTHYGPGYGLVPPDALGREHQWVKDKESRLFDIIQEKKLEEITPLIERDRSSCSPGSIEALCYWFQDSSSRPEVLLHDSSLIRGPSTNFVGYGTLGFL